MSRNRKTDEEPIRRTRDKAINELEACAFGKIRGRVTTERMREVVADATARAKKNRKVATKKGDK